MKIKAKSIISILLAVAVVPALVGSCCSKFIPSAYAEDNEITEQGQQILDDTRYSAVGFAPAVKTIIDFIAGAVGGELVDNFLSDNDGEISMHAINTAVDSYLSLKNYAINSTSGPTIDEVTSLIGKRKIVYPYNNMAETDYFFVYINKNSGAQVQQFGDYSIAPNTMLIVRQTNWAGVLVASLPIGQNGFTCPIVTEGLFTLRFNASPKKTLIFDTPMGTESLKIGTQYSGGTYDVRFINNEYNTIQDMYLIDYYTSHNNSFGDFQNDGEPLDWIECILGCPLNVNRDGTTAGARGVMRPIYMTTLFSNLSTRDKDGFNKDPNNIDPVKPPAYIMPTSHPLSYGNQITENNINNYNDYGMTIIDGKLDIDPTILAGTLVPQINPDFQGVLDGTFNAQPEIGLGFDTPLELDISSIVDTYIDTLIPQLPSGSVTRPLVPTVTTLSDWNLLPSYTTETMPQYVLDTVDDVNTSIIDLTDAMEITGIFMILALIGLLVYAIF